MHLKISSAERQPFCPVGNELISIPTDSLPGGLVVYKQGAAGVWPVLASPVVKHSAEKCMTFKLTNSNFETGWKFFIGLYKESDTITASQPLGYYNSTNFTGAVTLPVGTYRVIFASTDDYDDIKMIKVAVSDGACSVGEFKNLTNLSFDHDYLPTMSSRLRLVLPNVVE